MSFAALNVKLCFTFKTSLKIDISTRYQVYTSNEFKSLGGHARPGPDAFSMQL